MNTLAQDNAQKRMLQVRITEEAWRRLRVYCGLRDVLPGDVVTESLLEKLPPVDASLTVQEEAQV